MWKDDSSLVLLISVQTDLDNKCPGSHSTGKSVSPHILPPCSLGLLTQAKSCQSRGISSPIAWFAVMMSQSDCVLLCYSPPVISMLYGIRLYFYSQKCPERKSISCFPSSRYWISMENEVIHVISTEYKTVGICLTQYNQTVYHQ